MARTALAIVGAGIGALTPAAAGAQIGFLVGSVVGEILFPPTIQGPRLGEAQVQTGRDGIPIPIGWGLVHSSGNIIQQTPIIEVTTKEKQGKGGGTTVETTRRFMTFAIGVGRSSVGPIDSISRIWEFNKLVYDTRPSPAISAAETAKFAAGIRIYLGDETQFPDPDLEADTGVGLCPAYRGLAYVVFPNKDITDFGSAIPQYRFEWNAGADLTVTSRPYPIELIEGFDPSIALTGFRRFWQQPEGFDPGINITGITLNTLLNEHTIAAEGFDPTINITAIDNRTLRLTHTIAAEGFDPTINITSILNDPRRVTHSIAAEGFAPTINITGITLS